MVRFQKEEEEKTLKALTLFCFPEGVNWAPLTEYPRYCDHTQYFSKHALRRQKLHFFHFLSFSLFHSETFSFVLTDVDGSRKNGYCRRLLVNDDFLLFFLIFTVSAFNKYKC